MLRLRALLLAVYPVLSLGKEVSIVPLDSSEAGGLQRALLDVAQQRLAGAGLVLDREHAWLSVAGALPATGEIEVLPTWSSVAGIPELPLTFELRPRVRAGAARPAHATLAVRLQQPVWIARRRLRKGSQVSCADLAPGLREVRDPQRGSLLSACPDESAAAALRDIAAGEVLRVGDVGRAPDVQSGAAVQVRASSGTIQVTTTAVALADARVGDQIDVRLQRPTRTLRTRVIGRGTVQLADETP